MSYADSFGGLLDFGVGLSNTSQQAPIFLTPQAASSYSGGTSSAVMQAGVLDGSWMSQGAGLLSGLLTWDTTRRLTQTQEQAIKMRSTQNPNNTDYTTRAVSAAGGVRLGDLLPLAVVGFVAWRLLK